MKIVAGLPLWPCPDGVTRRGSDGVSTNPAWLGSILLATSVCLRNSENVISLEGTNPVLVSPNRAVSVAVQPVSNPWS
jgi:hypothetical protein